MKKFLNIKGSLMDLSTPLVMGIINITPDSFSPEAAKTRKKKFSKEQVKFWKKVELSSI